MSADQWVEMKVVKLVDEMAVQWDAARAGLSAVLLVVVMAD